MTEKSRSGAPLVEVVARVLWPHREKLLPRRTQLDFAPMPGDPIWIMAAEVVAALTLPTTTPASPPAPHPATEPPPRG